MNCKYCHNTVRRVKILKGGRGQYYCKQCNRYFNAKSDSVSDYTEEVSSYEQGQDFINIIYASTHIPTKEEILAQFKVDTKLWEVDRFKIKTSQGYRKDRKVDWHVDGGIVTKGDVEDSGKMLVVTLYHTEIHLTRKIEEIRKELVKYDLLVDVKTFSPKYPKLVYPKYDSEMLYEIDFPDLHFGRLTWEDESKDNYDIKIASQMVNKTVDTLLQYTKSFPVTKILLPLGNDFFNVDNKLETTTHGTFQQEDTRWQKTFKRGRELLVNIVDRCSVIAPVDILIIAGNHDEQRMFYLGDVLEAWYHNNKNVTVDNQARKRKYYSFGKNLIGFTHGYWERLEKLPSLMPVEVPELWSKSVYREWHTGDKHHKKDLLYKTDEGTGMVIRVLRSLAGVDTWSFDNGYVGALKAAESFLWSSDRGLIAQFTAIP